MAKKPQKNTAPEITIPTYSDEELEQEWNDRMESMCRPVRPEHIDRMIRRTSRPSCPECDAFPPVCEIKRPGYAAYRCRSCGHRFEAGER